MTTLRADHLWNAMPGWGIVGDLTPPELVRRRQLRRLRRTIAAALIALLALCVAGYVLAARQRASASAGLDGVQAKTGQLQVSAHKYAGVTRIQGTVTQIESELATLMSGDIDVAQLLKRMRAELPTTMTIRQETVTISLAGVTAGGAGSGLDTSGRARIGNVTISGAGRTLDDLSVYVERLKSVPGVVDIVPVSNVSDQSGMQYSLTLGLTDVLLSHRFDNTTKGGR